MIRNKIIISLLSIVFSLSLTLGFVFIAQDKSSSKVNNPNIENVATNASVASEINKNNGMIYVGNGSTLKFSGNILNSDVTDEYSIYVANGGYLEMKSGSSIENEDGIEAVGIYVENGGTADISEVYDVNAKSFTNSIVSIKLQSDEADVILSKTQTVKFNIDSGSVNKENTKIYGRYPEAEWGGIKVKETPLDYQNGCGYYLDNKYINPATDVTNRKIMVDDLESTTYYTRTATKDKVTISSEGLASCANTSITGEIVIPRESANGVTVVGIASSGFLNCSSISSVCVSNKVTRINTNAFGTGDTGKKSSSLSSINLINGINLIGNYAFANCVSLDFDIVIPETLTYFGIYSFYGCTGLEGNTLTIEQPKTAYDVGQYSFYNCKLAGSLEFPNNIKIIGARAFDGCLFTDGALILSETTTIIGNSSFKNCGFKGEIVIPDSVTEIQGSAFYQCKNITSIAFGSNIATIGSYAFAETTNLKRETLPDSLTTIGEYCFFNSGITYVEIPTSSKVTTIPNSCFKNCVNLTSVSLSDNITYIGNYAFGGASIKSVILPENLTTLGAFAFILNKNLSSVTFKSNFQTFEVDVNNESKSDVFAACYVLEDVLGFSDTQVKEIPRGVFYDCNALDSISFPKTLKSIGVSSFTNTALTSIYIPNNVESISSGAFRGCSSLKSLTIGSSVNSIGSTTFDGCTAIETLSVKTSELTITAGMFGGCSNLTKLTTYSNVGDNGFKDCSLLKELYFYGEEIVSIGSYAFAYTTSLEKVSLPSSLETIGEYCFYSSGIIELKTGTGITAIPEKCFSNCTNLQDVTIGSLYDYSKVESIATDAFDGCSAIDKLTVKTGKLTITASMFGGCSNLTTLTTLSNVGDNGFKGCSLLENLTFERITSLGNYAFADTTSLVGVDLPSSLKTIGKYCFNSSGVQSITIPAGVTEIPIGCFKYCSNLTTITLHDNISSLGSSCFAYSGLTSITIPSGVTEIPSYCFNRCEGLKECTISESNNITTIGENAFYYCLSLTTIKLKEMKSLKKIQVAAFACCSSLQTISLPESLGSDGLSEACIFQYCSSLEKITIPENVKILGNSIFDSCTSLTSINLPQGLNQIEKQAFAWCTSMRSIYIPFTDNASSGSGVHVNNMGSYVFDGWDSTATVIIGTKNFQDSYSDIDVDDYRDLCLYSKITNGKLNVIFDKYYETAIYIKQGNNTSNSLLDTIENNKVELEITYQNGKLTYKRGNQEKTYYGNSVTQITVYNKIGDHITTEQITSTSIKITINEDLDIESRLNRDYEYYQQYQVVIQIT